MHGNPDEILKRLTEARDAVPRHGDWQAVDLLTWRKTTAAMLEVFFDRDSPEVREFNAIHFNPTVFTSIQSPFSHDRERNVVRQREFDEKGYMRGLNQTAAYFAALIQKVQDLTAIKAVKTKGRDPMTTSSLSKPIFISHAVKDKIVVDALVDLLTTGLGISYNDIFCSSLEGMTIPEGEKFDQFINKQLQEPQIVVVILTHNYYESAFCLCELGAAWIKSHNVFPFLTTPLEFADLKAVLVGVQSRKMNTEGLNALRDTITEVLQLKVSSTRWEEKRSTFLANLSELLKSCGESDKVPRTEYEAAIKKVDELNADLEGAYAAIRERDKQIEDLKKCKDADQVRKVLTANGDVWEQFEDLQESARSELQKVVEVVRKSIMHTYLKKHYWPDTFENKYEWDQINVAANAKQVEVEENANVAPNRSDPKVKRAMKAVDALADFIEEKFSLLSDQYEMEFDHQLDLASSQVWEKHLLKGSARPWD